MGRDLVGPSRIYSALNSRRLVEEDSLLPRIIEHDYRIDIIVF